MQNQNRRYAVKIDEADMKRLRARADIFGYFIQIADMRPQESLLARVDKDRSVISAPATPLPLGLVSVFNAVEQPTPKIF